jgi:membrane-associated HD superfamily phosphohydrolase
MPVAVGEVANQDILAPYSITFESRVYTESARMEAAAAVPPVYLPPDPSIARHQLETLDSVLYYISTVRNDSIANRDQKIEDLAALADIKLSASVAAQIVDMSDPAWQNIDKEARRVLELVMRDTIRNENLAQVRSNLPAVIDFSIPTEQAQVIIALVSPLVAPNSLFSEEQTNLAREQARATIEPISLQIMAGEVLVRRGQIIREEDLEALNAFGLAKPINQTNRYITSAILVGILAVLGSLYLNRRQDRDFYQVKHLGLIAAVFIAFLALGRFLIIDRTVVPYLYPVAAFGLTV